MSLHPSNSPSSPDASASARPALVVAVVMRRERIQGEMSRWQPMRWVLADVVPNEASFGVEPRLLSKTDDEERWLHPGIVVELYRDDAEGYYLNVSTDAPGWFVFWRVEEQATVAAEPIARPVAVSLSYYDAGRWLDAQEMVEQVPAPPEVVQWLQVFVDATTYKSPSAASGPRVLNPWKTVLATLRR